MKVTQWIINPSLARHMYSLRPSSPKALVDVSGILRFLGLVDDRGRLVKSLLGRVIWIDRKTAKALAKNTRMYRMDRVVDRMLNHQRGNRKAPSMKEISEAQYRSKRVFRK